jgi:hypothetical protein
VLLLLILARVERRRRLLWLPLRLLLVGVVRISVGSWIVGSGEASLLLSGSGFRNRHPKGCTGLLMTQRRFLVAVLRLHSGDVVHWGRRLGGNTSDTAADGSGRQWGRRGRCLRLRQLLGEVIHLASEAFDVSLERFILGSCPLDLRFGLFLFKIGQHLTAQQRHSW